MDAANALLPTLVTFWCRALGPGDPNYPLCNDSVHAPAQHVLHMVRCDSLQL